MLNSGANQQKLFDNDWQCLKVTLWLEIITVYQTQNNLPFNFSLDIWKSFENIVLTQLQFNKPSKSLLSSFKKFCLNAMGCRCYSDMHGKFPSIMQNIFKTQFPSWILAKPGTCNGTFECLKYWGKSKSSDAIVLLITFEFFVVSS